MSSRNQTIRLTGDETLQYQKSLLHLDSLITPEKIRNELIHQDLLDTIPYLPEAFIDLMIIDPPYNLTKMYGENKFKAMNNGEYTEWFESWFLDLLKVLKPTATVYVCSDWYTSALIYPIISKWLTVRNRITWEREKGRGAKANWKNSSEDIWFCTLGQRYTFNVDAVKLKRKVLAPYRDKSGTAKDWQDEDGQNFRMTYPSNLWTDISVPFWSMPENTEHPTQKPEKLIAKLILASSNEGDWIFDPFSGSGTTNVVAKKLNRIYTGVERELNYACLSEKRLEMADIDKTIQGYHNGIFYERNSKP